MDRRLLPVLIALALPLAGCERGPAPAAEAPPTADSAPAADAGDGAMAPAAPEGTSALAGDVIVSTNEPFWQARVEGGEVVLVGPEVEGRRHAVTADGEADGVRRIEAAGEAGTITLTVMPGPCEDSMSGARFPLAGELVVDGGTPAPGCARPADMPPPVPADG